MLSTQPSLDSLSRLARTCGASASLLSRLFRQQMGVSMGDFRNRHRIERFFELYSDGYRLNITQAAFEAGFGSYAQFHRVFRKTLGYGPAELRRRKAQDASSRPPAPSSFGPASPALGSVAEHPEANDQRDRVS
jgi:AraC-like DNA-binding protein